jgi:hypothetical protein
VAAGRALVFGILTVALHACGLPSVAAEYEGKAQALATIQDDRIREASGIAASRANRDCYYVHNDSGDEPRVFLIDRQGRTRLTIRLSGVQVRDAEDIAIAPGRKAEAWDVCLADIGDNSASRDYVTILRFAEPVLSDDAERTIDVTPATFRLRYPDGPRDAEAFAVHPRTGAGYVLTKRIDGRCEVYTLPAPWDGSRESTLTRLTTLTLPLGLPPARVVTAADISPDGRRVAVRCYVNGWEWKLPADAPDGSFDAIFDVQPALLLLASEPQGEALCYSADGNAILTLSEGRAPTLYELRLATPTTARAAAPR